MLKISEIFWSAQGEGLNCGKQAIFIRLSGCSLQCSFCDTKESWQASRSIRTEKIIARVEKFTLRFHTKLVIITGGEPLEQDLTELVSSLKAKNYQIALETNGIYFQNLSLDHITISPKPAAAYRINQQWKRISEIKLVIDRKISFQTIKKLAESYPDIPLFLQPEKYWPDSYQKCWKFFKQASQINLYQVRLGIQLQNFYQIR